MERSITRKLVFSELDTDSTMIAGLSTVISTFLDEFISGNEKGLEIIERDNLSLISHRGTSTVFTVVSSPKLPSSYQNQIITVHENVLDEIPEEKINQSYSSSDDKLDQVILDALHNNGIRINLLFKLNFSADRFIEYVKFGAANIPSIVSRHEEFLKQFNLINVNLLEAFQILQAQTEMSDEKIAELIFGLDDIGLIKPVYEPNDDFTL